MSKKSKTAILCVDDERIVLTSLRDQIERHFGKTHQCELAQSADEALEVLAELNEDGVSTLIIVSDWLMPGMKGDELLIQVHQQFPKIKKILLTGQANLEAIDRTQKLADLHQYLSKPWEEEILIAVIASGLEEKDV
ncbi:response regulator [Oscillatoriales cyanobacterium LEGE 11467]|uniref:Response regulator n=1 Tax=Zarconia navalis LEGE 11467 TaxID=1828826 RepID=A0A928VSC3_9CYAN|nr:response regulator [Zarconia navalis]MBE9039499.1 response regulator [Zarconia navalis LEGE 11467]